MPMPTSPATDLLSPSAPQDTSLFSSPRPSGTWERAQCDLMCIVLSLSTRGETEVFNCLSPNSPTQWSGHELPPHVRDPQLPGGRDPSQRSARHPGPAASWPGVGQEGSTGWPPVWAGQWRSRDSVHWLLSLYSYEPRFLKKMFENCFQPSADGAVATEPNAGQRLVIWGTDVNVAICKEKFQVWT